MVEPADVAFEQLAQIRQVDELLDRVVTLLAELAEQEPGADRDHGGPRDHRRDRVEQLRGDRPRLERLSFTVGSRP